MPPLSIFLRTRAFIFLGSSSKDYEGIVYTFIFQNISQKRLYVSMLIIILVS